jgi:galactitol-specific phosphotransferase system IIB component
MYAGTYFGTNTSIQAISSGNLKENIEDLTAEESYNLLENINFKKYSYKTEESDIALHTGAIYEEIENNPNINQSMKNILLINNVDEDGDPNAKYIS